VARHIPGGATHTGRPTVGKVPLGRWDDVAVTKRWMQRAANSDALSKERWRYFLQRHTDATR